MKEDGKERTVWKHLCKAKTAGGNQNEKCQEFFNKTQPSEIAMIMMIGPTLTKYLKVSYK